MTTAATFYDRISGAYDLIADASEGVCRDYGVRALDVRVGERVLEIGFGTGHALAAFAHVVGAPSHVCGIELSRGMLQMARRRVDDAGVGEVLFAIDDARALCFQNEVFDAAFMSFTLELFEVDEIPIVLAEVNRVLRPSGRLGVVSMAHTAVPNAITEIYQWLHRHFPHFVDCRPIDVVGALTRAGFSVVSETTMSIWGLSVVTAIGNKCVDQRQLQERGPHGADRLRRSVFAPSPL